MNRRQFLGALACLGLLGRQREEFRHYTVAVPHTIAYDRWGNRLPAPVTIEKNVWIRENREGKRWILVPVEDRGVIYLPLN